MAGDWIKMRLDLAEDPAVMRMADKLGTREEHIVGYCHSFWAWVSRQCHDGSVTGVTLEALGRRINLPGFPEMLAEVGWLEYDDSGELPVITIPKFERHLSQGSKQRALANERQRASRANARNGSVTKTSRSQRDKSVTREEKRRDKSERVSEADGDFEMPPLPASVWTSENDSGVVAALIPWFGEWANPPPDKRPILGAVLAAREKDPTDPDKYVRRCLADGVQPKWINRAQKIINQRSSK